MARWKNKIIVNLNGPNNAFQFPKLKPWFSVASCLLKYTNNVILLRLQPQKQPSSTPSGNEPQKEEEDAKAK